MAAHELLRHVDPRCLLDHPFSATIYGAEEIDDAFIESVRIHGIEQPILVASDGKTIVAGHRRRKAAEILKLKQVPIVILRNLTDEMDTKVAIIEANRQRQKTPEQVGREAKAFLAIEAEKAAERRIRALKNGHPDVRQNSDGPQAPEEMEDEAGRADEIVAKRLGTSRDTVRKAIQIVDAIDTAQSEGNNERIESIRKQKSINAAYKRAVQSRPAKARASTDPLKPRVNAQVARRREFHTANLLMSDLAQELDRLSRGLEGSERSFRSVNAAWGKLCVAIIAWEDEWQKTLDAW